MYENNLLNCLYGLCDLNYASMENITYEITHFNINKKIICTSIPIIIVSHNTIHIIYILYYL